MVYRQKTTSKRSATIANWALWQIGLVLILATIVTATLLRLNNVRMIERKEAVLSADRSGDLGVLKERLYDLEEYVFKHMNASTGQFFLERTYRYQLDQIIEQAKNRPVVGGQVQNAYKIAAEICDQRFGGYSQAYADCFLREVNNHSTTVEAPREIKMLNPNLYVRSYSSPRWSPDLAGIAVLIWSMLVVYFVLRLIFWVGFGFYLRAK